MVFLCNPNNPTGILTPRSVVKKLLDKAKALDVRVCLDECFLDFVEHEEAYSAAGWLTEYPNLIILKSFTKMYAIPGLRLGYVLSADAELLNWMCLAGQPWSVSEPAQAAHGHLRVAELVHVLRRSQLGWRAGQHGGDRRLAVHLVQDGLDALREGDLVGHFLLLFGI